MIMYVFLFQYHDLNIQQDVSANLPFVHLIEHNLQKLYKAMKSGNDSLIQVSLYHHCNY